MQLTLIEGSEEEHRSRVAAGVQDVILILQHLAAALRHQARCVIFFNVTITIIIIIISDFFDVGETRLLEKKR